MAKLHPLPETVCVAPDADRVDDHEARGAGDSLDIRTPLLGIAHIDRARVGIVAGHPSGLAGSGDAYISHRAAETIVAGPLARCCDATDIGVAAVGRARVPIITEKRQELAARERVATVAGAGVLIVTSAHRAATHT
jgi:hypothetical protein